MPRIPAVTIRPRWLLLMACVLPLLVDPPTHAQPAPHQIESARGTFPVPPAIAMRGETFLVTLQRQAVIDYHGLEHFDLIVAKNGRATVTGDADLPLMRALNALNGQRVRLSIEPFEPARLDR